MPSPPGPDSIAISTVCLAGTLEDKLGAAAAAGFTGVELIEYDLVMSPWSPRRLAEEAARMGLSIEAYQPFHVEATPPDVFRATLRRAESKLELVSELGARVMVCCATRTADGIDDDDLAAEQLHSLADRAEAHGIRLAYEAVPWGRLRTHEDALRVVRNVDHPALGLCLDSFHALSPQNDSSVVDRIPVDKVFHVQLADAPRLNLDVREWSLHYRMFPGQGALDITGFVGRLLIKGYAGPMALEVFNDVYQQEDPRHAATDAMRSLHAFAEALGSLIPSERFASEDLPPVPELGGFAFAELALDDVSSPLVSRALTSLGFAHVSQHRSKPVQLWEQGGARVLLNLAPERSIAPATASISALAVESADPDVSMRRAERLLAPKLARRRAPDEADMSSVAAPDGTALFFCAPGTGRSWLDDFHPTGTSAVPSPWLTGIDHVSITESVDDFDQSTLFFRSVLGLDSGRGYGGHRALRTHPWLVGERHRTSRPRDPEHNRAATR